jgi:hypothetical protein
MRKIRNTRLKYTLLLLSFSTITYAQQKIDPTLEVKRDYDAKLLEITKGKLYSTFADSLGIFDMSFKYSIFDKPIKDLYEFSPLPSASIESEVKAKSPVLFLRASSNFPLNPSGQLYIQPRLPKSLSLLFYGNHESYHGKLPGTITEDNKIILSPQKYYAPSYKNEAGVKFSYKWKTGETGINGSFRNNLSSYSGIAEPHSRSYLKDSMSIRGNIYSGSFYIKSSNPDPNTFIYGLNVGYNALKSDARFTFLNLPETYTIKEAEENNLSLTALIGSGFGNSNKILAGITYEESTLSRIESTRRANLELFPRYIFKSNRWNFEAGLKYNIWWNESEKDYNIYFRGMASYEIVKENFWIYAGIDGKNCFNTYNKLLNLNPWIHPGTEIKNTEQPVIARGGFKGKIFDRLSYNIYGGYYEYNNQIYFYSIPAQYGGTNMPGNSYDAVYAHEKRTGIGADLKWISDRLEAGAGFDLYSFRDENNMTNNHYNYSPFELRSNIRYNWRERIVVNFDAEYRKKSPAISLPDIISSVYNPQKTYIPSYTLVNIELTYVHNKNLSLFLRVNNLLNSQVIFISAYSMPGLNGGLGLNLTF